MYSGIGGNRQSWGDEHKIVAVELDEKIANKYQKLYPNDEVIVADAHQYLLDNYDRFDFIWSSPPCQTHSRANYFINYITNSRYPDMSLWQEIIFLETFFKGKYCVENVISYYQYFIPPQIIGRHYLWSNFHITKIDLPKNDIGTMMSKYVGTGKHAHDKNIEDRNCVDAKLGEHILNIAMGIYEHNNREQGKLF